jgi:alpha-L-fucosidase
MYYTSVGRNSTFIGGPVPNPQGLIPSVDFQRYAELGKEIHRRFGHPVAEGRGQGQSVEIALPRPSSIDHTVAMEDITNGERIREYVVEGLTAGNNWTVLCRGISVGHKRIQRFSHVEVARVRLRMTRSVARPMLWSLAVYNAKAS